VSRLFDPAATAGQTGPRSEIITDPVFLGIRRVFEFNQQQFLLDLPDQIYLLFFLIHKKGLLLSIFHRGLSSFFIDEILPKSASNDCDNYHIFDIIKLTTGVALFPKNKRRPSEGE
jgi:hypothetical protein